MSFLLEIIRLGFTNLRLHLLRSTLTSLGIILGVAAVIIMVAIGEGKKQAALRDIQNLGATNVIVRSQRPPESASLGSEERSFVASFGITRADYRRLEHFLDDAAAMVPLKQVGDEVLYREKRMVSQAFGTTPDLLDVAKLRIDRGRYLSDKDLQIRSNVCVIGADVADKFFKLRDPIGAEIRIGGNTIFKVVGVLKPVGLAGGRGSMLVGRDLNKDIHIPLTTAQLVFGDTVFRRVSGSFSGEEVEVYEAYITARTNEDVVPLAQRVRRLMEVSHRDLADISIIVPWELLEQAERETRTMNRMLVAIAAISLLVGGIGIMNIKLASVTERTREIGIRRALGATRRHIVLQFLVETGTISMVGGVLGILLGIALSFGVEHLVPWMSEQPYFAMFFDGPTAGIETALKRWSIWISFLVATAVGLVFGIYPAIVASRQDPIVALRHD